ncbi:MAG: hypothetical protein ABI431_10120 [Candidatus Tumulicola sp.]
MSIHCPQSSTINASFAPDPCTRGIGAAGGAVTFSAGVADGAALGSLDSPALGSALASLCSVAVATGSGVSVADSSGASVSVGVDVTTAMVPSLCE